MWVIYVIEDSPNISTWCSGNISDSKPDDVGSIPTVDVLYKCKFLAREMVLNAEYV